MTHPIKPYSTVFYWKCHINFWKQKYNIFFFLCVKFYLLYKLSINWKFYTSYYKVIYFFYMILDYFLTLSFWEFCFLSIIIYNFVKILFSVNILFTLGYFFFFLLFNGIYFIFLECDLPIIILWIIYFGVIIIFGIFIFMWNENSHWRNKSPLFILIIGILIFNFMFSVNLNSTNLNFNYINYYQLLNTDNIEELELLGISFLYYNFSYFLLSVFFLLVNCLVVVGFFTSIKFFSFTQNFQNLKFLKKKLNFQWLIYKNQVFFLQDEENSFSSFSFLKNYKISHKIHKLKTWKRRI